MLHNILPLKLKMYLVCYTFLLGKPKFEKSLNVWMGNNFIRAMPLELLKKKKGPADHRFLDVQ